MAHEPERESKKERVLSPLKLVAGAIAAMISTWIGSLSGDSGTLIGVGVGSVIAGGGSTLLEHFGKSAHSKYGKWPSKRLVLKVSILKMSMIGAAATLGIAAVSILVITSVEASTGKTLHGITTGKQDYGTTLGGSSNTHPPSPIPTPTSAPSPSVSVSVSKSPTISPSPSSSPSLVTPSSSPSVTDVPSSPMVTSADTSSNTANPLGSPSP